MCGVCTMMHAEAKRKVGYPTQPCATLRQWFSTCEPWPFGSLAALSQGSHILYIKYFIYIMSHNNSKTSCEVAIKNILWLGSPQHEEVY